MTVADIENEKKLSDQLIQIPSSLLSVTTNSASLLAAASCDWHETCESGCEVSCEDQCERSCMDYCETYCQDGCELACQTGCEISGQNPSVYPSFSISTVNSTSVVLYVTIGSCNRFEIFCRTGSLSDGAGTTVWDQTVTRTSNFTYTISGLSPNTTYSVNIRWYYSSTSGWIGGQEFTTKRAKPTLWSWTASNGTATAAQTQAAYSAVTGNGAITDFSYLVWNDLVNKINDTCTAASSSWTATYATYAQTLMTSSDKTLTARRFNSARVNVGSRVSTEVSEVAAGESVMGSYFTKISTALNTWINSL